MTCPRKLQFFIKNVHLNFTICYMYLYGTVPLKYHFSKKMSPLTSKFVMYIYMYCPLKLPIFIKNAPLNFTICYMYLNGTVPLKYHFSRKMSP